MHRPGLIYATLLTLVILAGAGWLIAPHFLSPSEPREDRVATTIGQLRLVVPAAYLRSCAQQNCTRDRLDLVMTYPGLDPIDVRQPERDPRLLVFATIEPMDGVIDPSERINALYGRFLEAGVFDHPGGLIMRRFQATSPYTGEELYVAPPDGSTFHARCPTSVAAHSPACLWRMRQKQADITIRMAPELLPHWEEISTGVHARLKEWVSGQ
jgi:hypothetical protein